MFSKLSTLCGIFFLKDGKELRIGVKSPLKKKNPTPITKTTCAPPEPMRNLFSFELSPVSRCPHLVTGQIVFLTSITISLLLYICFYYRTSEYYVCIFFIHSLSLLLFLRHAEEKDDSRGGFRW